MTKCYCDPHIEHCSVCQPHLWVMKKDAAPVEQSHKELEAIVERRLEREYRLGLRPIPAATISDERILEIAGELVPFEDRRQVVAFARAVIKEVSK